MFERFTRAARETVIRAQAEARELGHAPIGTEHVLLALLADPAGPVASAPALREKQVDAGYARAEIIRRAGGDTGTAATDADAADREALRAIGIDLDAVRRAIEENFGPGALNLPREPAPKRKGLFRRGTGHIPFSPRAKKVLELSLREAIRLKHNYIAPEHIMLGVLREERGPGAQILAERGVDADELRADLARSLHADAA
ncbi:Clp protease N-terminal domain-containing protein [Couchioplanes caeruleus]|uniref:Clp protease n=2 Tax=Couchioplanes caeruleus TaxID=56438 RepID=A0A1K0FGB3_9ACTN|nr:Clp protease N-terminal domain-containing protein [Couchioplanes caeruleus]OJF11887.1 Clp protease [Couchioplanes caeruleus subsp. caeruleus]ROP33194.1 ClpA/ClpB-like protein [Couchioplanes caeruleus]